MPDFRAIESVLCESILEAIVILNSDLTTQGARFFSSAGLNCFGFIMVFS